MRKSVLALDTIADLVENISSYRSVVLEVPLRQLMIRLPQSIHFSRFIQSIHFSQFADRKLVDTQISREKLAQLASECHSCNSTATSVAVLLIRALYIAANQKQNLAIKKNKQNRHVLNPVKYSNGKLKPSAGARHTADRKAFRHFSLSKKLV